MQFSNLRNIRGRDNRGAAIITLCLVLSLFLIFIIFFVFDMNRMQMAQRQVSAICDAAALAGSAMLTSKDTSYEDSNLDLLNTTQLAAEQYAKNMLAMGNILGRQCYDPAATGTVTNGIALNFVSTTAALANPAANHMNVLVQLCSPIQGYTVVAPGNSSARALYIQANYGYVPFLSAIGIQSVSLPAKSTSSLQKLFVVMVFDCSGSMDDNTTVSFVYRRWTQSTDPAANKNANGGKGQYMYTVVGSPGGGAGQSQLWQYSGLDYSNQPNGTALNVLPPQNLDYMGLLFGNAYHSYASSNTAFATSTGSPPLAFDMAIAHYVPWQAGALSGCYNSSYTTHAASGSGFQGPYYDNYFGTPPGNCPVKYGACAASSSYGGNIAANTSTATSVMNIWNGVSTTVRPGPGFSPGYYYYPNGYGNANAQGNMGSDGHGNDNNFYFYDPYSMPNMNTNASYTAFTDLVANITTVSPPVTQPFYGPTTFASFTQTFVEGSYTVPMAETTAASTTIGCVYEYDNTLYNGGAYKFSNIAYVVEASRGNLDFEWSGTNIQSNTQTNYDNALLNYGSNVGNIARTDCKGGYQKAYQRLAMYVLQPYATAVDGAMRFFQNLCQTSACNFGLVGFSVAPAVSSNYTCEYIYGSGNNNYYSLAVADPANGMKPTVSPYSGYVYAPPQLYGGSTSNSRFLINPNTWVSVPGSSLNSGQYIPSGPAGGLGTTGTGEAYHSALNTAGPTRTTWLTVNGNSTTAPSGNNTLWAYNNPGFQIPRAGCSTSNSQSNAYYLCSGSDYAGFSFSNPGGAIGGINGIQHARPMYETAGLEALEMGLYNLTNIPALNALVGTSTGLPSISEYGCKKAIVFFTDGIPTDDNGPSYPLYTAGVVTPAQTAGVSIYSIGLALNDNIKTAQYTFLSTLANKGACGSQQYQITSNGSLTSTFTGIARQMAQCQR